MIDDQPFLVVGHRKKVHLVSISYYSVTGLNTLRNVFAR